MSRRVLNSTYRPSYRAIDTRVIHRWRKLIKGSGELEIVARVLENVAR